MRKQNFNVGSCLSKKWDWDEPSVIRKEKRKSAVVNAFIVVYFIVAPIACGVGTLLLLTGILGVAGFPQ